jgi:hypothetical protein
MALINVGESQPSPMWAVTRYLADAGRPVRTEEARALLSPPCFGPADVFDGAVSSLRTLGIVEVTPEGRLILTWAAKLIDRQHFSSFAAVLRDRVLAPELNTGIGDNDSQVGPRDLTRALAWFLSLDPGLTELNASEAQQRQAGALKEAVGPAIVNPARWNLFTDWAAALGLAAPGLLDNDRLTPDCTAAVRQVIGSTWNPGETVSAIEVLHRCRTALPVLPGGEYAVAVGVASPGESSTGPALSFALLRGDDEEWLQLRRSADARQPLNIDEPGSRFSRPWSSIVIGESINA